MGYAFVKSLSSRVKSEAVAESLNADKLDDATLESQFNYIAGGAKIIELERFCAFVSRLAYRMVKDGVLSEASDIKSAPIRRLEQGEIIECLAMPETSEKG